jgi:hypothetical protein
MVMGDLVTEVDVSRAGRRAAAIRRPFAARSSGSRRW